MNLDLSVNAKATVNISEIAGQFSEMNGDQQAIFLQEIFDALEFRCKEQGKFEAQLSWISIGINRYNFKRLEYVFESLSYFMKDQP